METPKLNPKLKSQIRTIKREKKPYCLLRKGSHSHQQPKPENSISRTRLLSLFLSTRSYNSLFETETVNKKRDW
jgi:hypothetical protein